MPDVYHPSERARLWRGSQRTHGHMPTQVPFQKSDHSPRGWGTAAFER